MKTTAMNARHTELDLTKIRDKNSSEGYALPMDRPRNLSSLQAPGAHPGQGGQGCLPSPNVMMYAITSFMACSSARVMAMGRMSPP